jgi:hypothetical protein
MGKKRNAYLVLVGKPEEKRQLGRFRSRWKDNIKIVLSDIGWCGINWIHLSQDRDLVEASCVTSCYILGNS